GVLPGPAAVARSVHRDADIVHIPGDHPAMLAAEKREGRGPTRRTDCPALSVATKPPGETTARPTAANGSRTRPIVDSEVVASAAAPAPATERTDATTLPRATRDHTR